MNLGKLPCLDHLDSVLEKLDDRYKAGDHVGMQDFFYFLQSSTTEWTRIKENRADSTVNIILEEVFRIVFQVDWKFPLKQQSDTLSMQNIKGAKKLFEKSMDHLEKKSGQRECHQMMSAVFATAVPLKTIGMLGPSLLTKFLSQTSILSSLLK